MISIANNGQSIEHTTYFDSQPATAGFLYASWNAGALRILLPDSALDMLIEMKMGTQVGVTRGTLQGRKDALEIMFDDNSDAPYAIHIVREQYDNLIRDENVSITVSVWGRSGKLAEWPGFYRTAQTLPFLEPLPEIKHGSV
ncbi:hypothetical protein ABRP83_13805 [Pectobacterium brasiliense]|uniref:hypothetical protein n=1 Tax=Pectobacterium brasiliense TaxID=180957 RepID=UPI0032F06E0A